jgi:hypothetical protein
MFVWVVVVAALGLVAIGCGYLAMTRVDVRWRAQHLQCCRCATRWFGRRKMCERCGARGNSYDWLTVRFAGFPTHDWQGYLETGPIPVVPAQRAPVETTWTSVPAPRPAQEPADR